MNKLLLFFLLSSISLNAQDYVDLVKIGYGRTFQNTFEEVAGDTQVQSVEADLTLPIVLNENHALISGLSYSRNHLQLAPNTTFVSLYSTTLKAGWAATYNEFWSSTLVLLPKIASDYENISGDDFYLGGFGLLKYQKKKNLIYRFGAYGSQEAFGFFTTPIIGWYYLSENQKFEMDVSLPIATDINYRLGMLTLGLDYYGIGRSFNLTTTSDPDVYVDLSSLEFATYVQYNAFDRQVLLRGKFGYSSNNYEVYQQGETIDLGLSAFSFGDDRNRLNPVINGGFFLKFEAIYRFQITPND